MSIPDRGPRSAVKAIIVRDGQVLLNRSRMGDREWFDLPGGGQHWGESAVEALVRECAEEIGAPVEVFELATVWEYRNRVGALGGEIPFEHQLNLGFWCGLADGAEPDHAATTELDDDQVGTAWIPIERLAEHDVIPRAVAQWLASDPSSRPVFLGEIDLFEAPGSALGA